MKCKSFQGFTEDRYGSSFYCSSHVRASFSRHLISSTMQDPTIRVDPSDGVARTLAELSKHYSGAFLNMSPQAHQTFKDTAIQAYWDKVCIPVTKEHMHLQPHMQHQARDCQSPDASYTLMECLEDIDTKQLEVDLSTSVLVCRDRLLGYSASAGDLEAVRALCALGADVKSLSVMLDFKQMTRRTGDPPLKIDAPPLVRAADAGHLEVVRFLCEARADVNQEFYAKGPVNPKPQPRGVLRFAARADLEGLEIMRYLIEEAGADLQQQKSKTKTPSHDAAIHGSVELMRYLCEEAGFSVNTPDQGGGTALMYAAERGNIEMVRYLCENGADPDKVNIKGVTASDVARLEVAKPRTTHGRIVDYLKEHSLQA